MHLLVLNTSSMEVPNIYKTEMSSSSILTTGIPTPNLSGVLTGIKTHPLFSLHGARSDLNINKAKGLQDDMMKPVYTMCGSLSNRSSSMSKLRIETSVSFSTVVAGSNEITFLKTTIQSCIMIEHGQLPLYDPPAC